MNNDTKQNNDTRIKGWIYYLFFLTFDMKVTTGTSEDFKEIAYVVLIRFRPFKKWKHLKSGINHNFLFPVDFSKKID
jgi:hypothetical protein